MFHIETKRKAELFNIILKALCNSMLWILYERQTNEIFRTEKQQELS
jgi:hypothetical protein